MRYTIELHTAAGALLVGLFDTLDAARTAATGHRCAIRPIIAADDLAALIAAPTTAALEKLVLDEPAPLALRSTEAQHRAHEHKRQPVNKNKYAGKCECGTWVEADTGYYDVRVFCLEPVVLFGGRLVCPNHAETVKAEVAAINERIRAHSTYTPPVGITPNTCAKCDGTGKFHYWNGEVGVCYPCDGSGKIQ